MKLGLPVEVVKNFSRDDVLGISSKIKQAQRRTCSGLVVGIMAHGLRGCIQDKNKKLISINEIIIDMDTPEMKGKPKVLIIQSCQGFPEPEDPNPEPSCDSIAAPTLDPARPSGASSTGNNPPPRPPPPTHQEFEMEGQPIELRQKDFSLIVSSVSGEKSVRNAFIPILSKYISESKPDEDIDSCFRKANCELQELYPEQTAKHDNTLRKKVAFGGVYKLLKD